MSETTGPAETQPIDRTALEARRTELLNERLRLQQERDAVDAKIAAVAAKLGVISDDLELDDLQKKLPGMVDSLQSSEESYDVSTLPSEHLKAWRDDLDLEGREVDKVRARIEELLAKKK